jgi:hypothetical protein
MPVLVSLANRSRTVWSVDAGEISASVSSNSRLWLPVPADEAARIAPVSTTDGVTAIIDRAGDFGAYAAGLGAAAGAFTAGAKADDVDSGFELGAAFGAALGFVTGGIFEYFRLTRSYETKEAGEANEKMKFLALKGRSTLYSGYSAIGYVYFLPDTGALADSSNKIAITIPLLEGNPSNNQVCECRVLLNRCDKPEDPVRCHATGNRLSDGLCESSVHNDIFLSGIPASENQTSGVLRKY